MSADASLAATREPRAPEPTTHDDGPTPDQIERLGRALTEYLFVDAHAHAYDGGETGLYDVYGESGTQYTVDVESGACSCPDHEYNRPAGDDEWRCKHALRAEMADGRRGLPPWANADAVRDPLLRDDLGLEEVRQ